MPKKHIKYSDIKNKSDDVEILHILDLCYLEGYNVITDDCIVYECDFGIYLNSLVKKNLITIEKRDIFVKWIKEAIKN